jgi:hypothetical protein
MNGNQLSKVQWSSCRENTDAEVYRMSEHSADFEGTPERRTVPEPAAHKSREIGSKQLQERSWGTQEEIGQNECLFTPDILHHGCRHERACRCSYKRDGDNEV